MASWVKVGYISDIMPLSARVIKAAEGDIAVFRTSDDKIFAIADSCPHKKGKLSQGIVSGHSVTCPLHNWRIKLSTGEAIAPDEGCSSHYAVKITDEGEIYVDLIPAPADVNTIPIVAEV